MNRIKVIDLIEDLNEYQILYLRNYKNPSVKYAYRPICVILILQKKRKFMHDTVAP